MVKVLIVDDEYIMRQGLKYMIDWEKEGFEIVGEAANGLEALSLIQKETPHIVICDRRLRNATSRINTAFFVT